MPGQMIQEMLAGGITEPSNNPATIIPLCPQGRGGEVEIPLSEYRNGQGLLTLYTGLTSPWNI